MKMAKIEKENSRFWLVPGPDGTNTVIQQEFQEPDLLLAGRIRNGCWTELELTYRGTAPKQISLRNDFAAKRLAMYDDTKVGRFDDMIQRIYMCERGSDFVFTLEPGRFYRIIGVI